MDLINRVVPVDDGLKRIGLPINDAYIYVMSCNPTQTSSCFDRHV